MALLPSDLQMYYCRNYRWYARCDHNSFCRQCEVMKYSNMLTSVFDLNIFGMQF